MSDAQREAPQMRFYSVSLGGQCEKCDKPSTYEIRGPFSARYGTVCQRHIAVKIAELEKAHATTPTAEMPRI